MDELDGVLDRIDALAGRPRTVEPLLGGLTNRNLKVTTDTGRFVVRISRPETSVLAIDRDAEYRNSLAAAEAGVGAPVVAYRPEDHVLVVGFIEGRTLSDADLHRPGMLARVAAACRRLHDRARFANDFDMFAVQRRYLRIVLDHGYPIPDGYRGHEPAVAEIGRALAASPAASVACHNDLLAGNLVDDGTDIRLIDYEYSGNNDPCFELGNLWSECGLSLPELDELVAGYFGRPAPQMVARARLQGLLSQYGWTLWAAIQSATSDLDFDFWSWGLDKYRRAQATFTGPEFADLLAAVRHAD